MMVEASFWQIVGAAFSVSGAVIAAFWALSRVLIAQFTRQLEAKFQAITDALSRQDTESRALLAQVRQVERDLMELRAELPREYVRREDYLRGIGTVQVTIDNLRLTVERAMTSRGSA
jgi:chromosome segregation ATPase